MANISLLASENAYVLALVDNKIGANSQVSSLASSLNLPVAYLEIRHDSLLAGLPNFISGLGLAYVDRQNQSLLTSGIISNAIIVSASRKNARVSAYLKRSHKQQVVNIHIGRPQISYRYFDNVVLPIWDNKHDKHGKIIRVMSSLHNITPRYIDNEVQPLAELERFSHQPILAILIGGASKHGKWNKLATSKIKAAIAIWQEQHPKAVIFIASSRRSDVAAVEEVKGFLLARGIAHHSCLWHEDNSYNFYQHYLKYANVLLVTEDSSSMISECVGTGKTTYILKFLDNKSSADKPVKFYQGFLDQGLAKVFSGVDLSCSDNKNHYNAIEVVKSQLKFIK